MLFSLKWGFIILLSVAIDSLLEKKKKDLCLVSSGLKRPEDKTKLEPDSGNKDTSQAIVHLIWGYSLPVNQGDLPGKFLLT